MGRRAPSVFENNLAALLGDNPDFPLDKGEIDEILEERMYFVGNAKKQINSVVGKAKDLINRYPTEASYEPGQIL